MSQSVSAAVRAPGRLEFARNAVLDVLVWRALETTREWTCVHPTTTLILFDDSSADMWYRGTLERCQPGDLGIFEAGQVSRCWNQVARGDFRFIELPADLFAGAVAGPAWPRPLVRGDELRAQTAQLFDAVEAEHPLADVETLLAAVAASLARLGRGAAGGVRPGESPAMARVRAHIDASLSKPLPIEDLAAVADMSRFAFVRAWKREVGLPPHAYVVHRRVMAARRRLCDGAAIAAVADECGFHDQSHLHRHFKRITGVTPGAFQRKLRVQV